MALKILPKASVMAFSLQEQLAGLYRKRHLCNLLRKVISKLKLRASYGQVGNANLSGRRFAYLSTITDDSWDDIETCINGVLDSSYGCNWYGGR